MRFIEQSVHVTKNNLKTYLLMQVLLNTLNLLSEALYY